MKKLKIVFHALYFAYLLVSVLMFAFKDKLYDQISDLSFLLRFVNFWIVLGFFFFIAMWIIQVVHIKFMKKDMDDLEDELYTVKSRLYDINRIKAEAEVSPEKMEESIAPSIEGSPESR